MTALTALLWAAGRVHGLSLLPVAAAYGILMNTGYAIIHEAEHGILHPTPSINNGIGVVLALFFPAPFHLIRQGHLGHHLRNRSDDEAFDFYFEGENPVWKHLQLYGILTGAFWVVIALSNVLAALAPGLLHPNNGRIDRPTEALLESLNPKYRTLIRVEAWAAILLHAALNRAFSIPIANHAAVLFGFGFLWSAMQYVHHFGTAREVATGARNLRTFRWLDAVWLNHNWHLNHHMHPTVPWIHLPGLAEPRRDGRDSLLAAYFRMWTGPRFTTERVENRFAGRVIR